LSPSTWQGVAVTVVAVVLTVTSVLLIQPMIIGVLIAVLVLVGFVAVALITGEPPGGPRRST
jgi:hypothetical protein